MDYCWIVLARATDGKLDEFETWYDEIHLREVCNIPGIKSAKRFRVSSTTALLHDEPKWDSVAIYEFETDDPVAVTERVQAAAGTAQMMISDALSPDAVTMIASPVASYP